MKLSRSNVRGIVAAGLVMACLLSWVTPAFASLDDPPSGTSSTNPNAGDAAWRDDWGHSLNPEFTITSIPSDPGSVTTGFFYRWARQPLAPDLLLSPKVGISWEATGSTVSHTYDLTGIFSTLPDSERLYLPQPDEVIHDPREGLWYLSMQFYNDYKVANEWTAGRFGIDLTPPRKVSGFTSGVGLPTESSRRNFTFLKAEYDDLSGVYWYVLRIRYADGTETSLRQHLTDFLPGKVTVEDLKPGVNRIGISVIDRADNESQIVWRTEIVDPDVPSLAIKTPASSAWLAGTQLFSVDASDQAGISAVAYRIDGVVKATATTAPYGAYIDTRKLGAGKHTLTVTATDLFGHTRSAGRIFYVDNAAPTLSAISDSPDPFFPVLEDGYKDDIRFAFTVNEPTVELWLNAYQVIDDQRAASPFGYWHGVNQPAGQFAVSWDGRGSDGRTAVLPLSSTYGPATAKFVYQIVAKDRAGNTTRSAFYPFSYANFEMTKTSSGSVKVVAR